MYNINLESRKYKCAVCEGLITHENIGAIISNGIVRTLIVIAVKIATGLSFSLLQKLKLHILQ
jgi:hypothetical protein